MKKICAPSKEIYELLLEISNPSATENMQNVEKWIEVLLAPLSNFSNSGYRIDYEFGVMKAWEYPEDFNELPELIVRFYFLAIAPTLLAEEKKSDHMPNRYPVYIDLECGNKAEMYHSSGEKIWEIDGKSVSKIIGTWEEILTAYLNFVKKLTTIPTLPVS